MALFKTVAEIKGYLSAIQKNLDIETILSFVEESELLYIQPYLGDDLYSSLLAGYQADTLSPAFTDLLPQVQRPLAHFAFYQMSCMGNVFASNLGFHTVQTDNTNSAKEWEMDKLITYTCQTADSFLDKLIQYLEKKVGVLSQWQSSDFYAQNKSLLLNSAKQLQDRIQIKNSRLGYYQLRPVLRLAEKKYVENEISEVFLADLKTKIQNNNLSSDELKVVDLARDVLAFYGLYEALPDLAEWLSPNGITATLFQDALKKIKPVDYQLIMEKKASAGDNGKMFLQTLKKYLDANADLFPLYRDSSKYNPPPAVKSYEVVDNSDSPIFYMK